MTFVVGRRFDKRIVIMADTMITQPEDVKHNIIPGQLKAIVLNLQLSMAFCGLVHMGLDSARACKAKLEQGGNLEDILRILTHASHQGCDFLIASHINGPELIKVSEGRVSTPQDMHWLGDPNILKLMQAQSDKFHEGYQNVLRMNPDMRPEAVNEEQLYISSFTQLMLGNPLVRKTVGGLAVTLLASPYGHCYTQHAGAYSPGPISIGGPPHPEALAPGGDRYGYNFLESGHRGVGIAGAFLEDGKVGYIYDPLHSDNPSKFTDTTMQEIIDELRELGGRYGGKPEAEC